MLRFLALQRAAAAAAAQQYQFHAAAAATTTTAARGATASAPSSSPCSSSSSLPARSLTTSAPAEHAAQPQPADQDKGTTSKEQQPQQPQQPRTLGRPPRTFSSRRERDAPTPPTAAVDFAPYQLKVYLSNRYTYASILHKASPSDPGTFVASASTLGERPPRKREQEPAQEATRAGGGSNEQDGNNTNQQAPPSRVSLSDSAASARVGKALAEAAAAAGLVSPHAPVPVRLSTRTRRRAAGEAPARRGSEDPRTGSGRNPRRRFVGRLRALVEAAREAGLLVH